MTDGFLLFFLDISMFLMFEWWERFRGGSSCVCSSFPLSWRKKMTLMV